MDEKERDEIKEEISELKKKIDKLNNRLDKDRIRQEEREAKKNREVEEKISQSISSKQEPNYVRTLIILVIIILIVDGVSFFLYSKPDLSGLIKFNYGNKTVSSVKNSTRISSSIPESCSDGTLNRECSKTKPYFCYDGNLIKSGYGCGCPEGYVLDFQDCVKTS